MTSQVPYLSSPPHTRKPHTFIHVLICNVQAPDRLAESARKRPVVVPMAQMTMM